MYKISYIFSQGISYFLILTSEKSKFVIWVRLREIVQVEVMAW